MADQTQIENATPRAAGEDIVPAKERVVPAGSRVPVVMIARHYPPDPEVGGRRALKIATALTEAGHPVTVIRAGRNAETIRPTPLLTVRSVDPLPSLRALYSATREGFRASFRPANGSGARTPEEWVPPQTVHPFKRLVTSLMWLPDDDQGFIWPAATAAADALRQAGPRAVLYTTSPPHSTHIAGLLVKLWSGVPWVVEFRDPWTGNPGKAWYYRSSFTDAVEHRLEKACLRRAEAIVGVSQGICRQIDHKLARYRDQNPPPVVLARNGIAQFGSGGESRPAKKPFRIVHAGTLYIGRDPQPFLTAVANIVRRKDLSPSDLQVELIGDTAFAGRSVDEMISGAGLGQFVRLEGWLPHQEAEQRLKSADLLLLLAEDQPLQVPNKLYEYLGMSRPILAFADREGETASMIEAIGSHWVVQRSHPEAVEAALEAALAGARPPAKHNRAAVLEEWTVARQIARVVRTVQRVGGAPLGLAHRSRSNPGAL